MNRVMNTCIAAAVSLTAYCAPAAAQTAYFSATGAYSASSGLDNIYFALDSTADVTMRTWAHGGGVNAAGETISPGGVDSLLTLFDAFFTQIAQNDNISATELDSLIHEPALPAGAYRFTANTPAPQPPGVNRWAVDLVRNDAGSLTLRGIAPAGSNLSRVTFGVNGTPGPARAVLELELPVEMVGSASLEVRRGGLLRVNNGSHLFAGAHVTGEVELNDGYFYATQPVVVESGGTVRAGLGSRLIAPLTIGTGGAGTFAAVTLSNQHPIRVIGGGKLWTTSQFFTSANSTVVENPGSQVIANSVAVYGSTINGARLTVADHATIDVSGGVLVGRSTSGSSDQPLPGRLVINNASVSFTGQLSMGTGAGSGTIELGSNGRLTQTGNATFNIGAPWTSQAGQGAGTILIHGGEAITGTGAVRLWRLGYLFVGSGGTFRINGTWSQESAIGTSISGPRLTIGGSTGSWNGRVDLTDRGATFSFTSIAGRDVALDQLKSGFDGGSWDGFGITSSAAAANPGRALGYALQNTSQPTLRMIYTRYGDANLDLTVNLDDFNALVANFGQTDRRWADGDFNFDFVVNLNDFNLLAANFGLSAAGPSVTPADWAALGSAVPEPSVALSALIISATWGMTARVRRGAPPRRPARATRPRRRRLRAQGL